MEGAEEPAELLLVGEVFQRGVGFVRGGHIDEGEERAGDELHHQAEERGAAEDIEPTAGALGDMVPGGGFPDFPHMQAVVHPVENREAEVRDFLGGGLHMFGWASVGREPARIMRSPFSTLNW